MAVRGLTDIHARFQGHTVPEGDCGHVSITQSTSVLQHLCNTFDSMYSITQNCRGITMLQVRYYA